MHRAFARSVQSNRCWKLQLHEKQTPVQFQRYRQRNILNPMASNGESFRTASTTAVPDGSSREHTTKAEIGNREVQINIKLPNGEVVRRTISRSFPKAKPTKLVIELERLLSASSTDHQESTDDSVKDTKLQNPTAASHEPRWILNPGGNGISTTLLVPESSLQDFVSTIEREADEVQHHPHVAKSWLEETSSWIVGITCTTHQPAGLSMRDVRLADRVDQIVGGQFTNDIVNADDEEFGAIAETLQMTNIKAAEEAVANPDSKCALHVQAVKDRPQA